MRALAVLPLLTVALVSGAGSAKAQSAAPISLPLSPPDRLDIYRRLAAARLPCFSETWGRATDLTTCLERADRSIWREKLPQADQNDVLTQGFLDAKAAAAAFDEGQVSLGVFIARLEALDQRTAETLARPPTPSPDLPANAEIMRPDWARPPDPRVLARVYPPAARRSGIPGRAVIDCVVLETGKLDNCRPGTEEPAGAGFGAAAVEAAKTFLMKPMRVNGRPVGGGKVRIPLRWTVSEPTFWDVARDSIPRSLGVTGESPAR